MPSGSRSGLGGATFTDVGTSQRVVVGVQRDAGSCHMVTAMVPETLRLVRASSALLRSVKVPSGHLPVEPCAVRSSAWSDRPAAGQRAYGGGFWHRVGTGRTVRAVGHHGRRVPLFRSASAPRPVTCLADGGSPLGKPDLVLGASAAPPPAGQLPPKTPARLPHLRTGQRPLRPELAEVLGPQTRRGQEARPGTACPRPPARQRPVGPVHDRRC